VMRQNTGRGGAVEFTWHYPSGLTGATLIPRVDERAVL
jgi:hypothetical protein